MIDFISEHAERSPSRLRNSGVCFNMRVFPRWSWAFAFTTLLAAPGLAQASADGVADALGSEMAFASVCARPTAPIEAELEHYLERVGAGPLEANRVRQAMVRAATKYHSAAVYRLEHMGVTCSIADREIADTIANVRAATP
jgi:hypothetical protein